MDWPIDPPIVSPVEGTAARQHLLVEHAADLHNDHVLRAEIQQRSDIKGKSGVSLTQVLTSLGSVNPDIRRVKDCFKFNSDGSVLPLLPTIKRAAVPCDAKIVRRSGGDLPCVRDRNFVPA